MLYRYLGHTGLQVSEICLGTMQFLWTAGAEDSHATLDLFYDSGGNFVDTADVYTRRGAGVGSVETLLGNWMQRRKNRHDIVLATKVRGVMWSGPNGEGLSRQHIMRAAEDSLRRLQTDYIDLYQAHWIDMNTPIEETLRAFDDLVRQGKVRYVGGSNYSAPWRLAEALLVGKYEGLATYVSYQPHYNLVYREEFERWLLPLVRKHGLGVIAWSPLEGGLLTGKYRRGQPPPASKRAADLADQLTERTFAIVDRLEALGRARGKTIAQMALGWLLAHEWMTAPIVGANNPDQLRELLGAVGLRLTPEEKTDLDEISMWSKPEWWPLGL